MDDPYERYYNDPEFKSLVDCIFIMLLRAQFTPYEVKQAAVVACVKLERERPPKPIYMTDIPQFILDAAEQDPHYQQMQEITDRIKKRAEESQFGKELREGEWPKPSKSK